VAEHNYYRKAYETAKQELTDLIATQDKLEKRKLVLRKLIETLAGICDSEGIAVEPSAEADYLRMRTTLADEIRAILRSHYPGWCQPLQLKKELEALGHDLEKYTNPQATIHMVLKRMAESGEAQEGTTPEDGKKAYRSSTLHSLGNLQTVFQEVSRQLEGVNTSAVQSTIDQITKEMSNRQGEIEKALKKWPVPTPTVNFPMPTVKEKKK
jgi:hypothetical protein